MIMSANPGSSQAPHNMQMSEPHKLKTWTMLGGKLVSAQKNFKPGLQESGMWQYPAFLKQIRGLAASGGVTHLYQ